MDTLVTRHFLRRFSRQGACPPGRTLDRGTICSNQRGFLQGQHRPQVNCSGPHPKPPAPSLPARLQSGAKSLQNFAFEDLNHRSRAHRGDSVGGWKARRGGQGTSSALAPLPGNSCFPVGEMGHAALLATRDPHHMGSLAGSVSGGWGRPSPGSSSLSQALLLSGARTGSFTIQESIKVQGDHENWLGQQTHSNFGLQGRKGFSIMGYSTFRGDREWKVICWGRGRTGTSLIQKSPLLAGTPYNLEKALGRGQCSRFLASGQRHCHTYRAGQQGMRAALSSCAQAVGIQWAAVTLGVRLSLMSLRVGSGLAPLLPVLPLHHQGQ